MTDKPHVTPQDPNVEPEGYGDGKPLSLMRDPSSAPPIGLPRIWRNEGQYRRSSPREFLLV
jgi:hypothetical protein